MAKSKSSSGYVGPILDVSSIPPQDTFPQSVPSVQVQVPYEYQTSTNTKIKRFPIVKQLDVYKFGETSNSQSELSFTADKDYIFKSWAINLTTDPIKGSGNGDTHAYIEVYAPSAQPFGTRVDRFLKKVYGQTYVSPDTGDIHNCIFLTGNESFVVYEGEVVLLHVGWSITLTTIAAHLSCQLQPFR